MKRLLLIILASAAVQGAYAAEAVSAVRRAFASETASPVRTAVNTYLTAVRATAFTYFISQNPISTIATVALASSPLWINQTLDSAIAFLEDFNGFMREG